MERRAAAADQRGQAGPRQAVLLRRTVRHSPGPACRPATAAIQHLRSSSRCDSKAFKRLMSGFGSSRSEESCSAVVELLERVTRLQKEPELRERQQEVDAEQVRGRDLG